MKRNVLFRVLASTLLLSTACADPGMDGASKLDTTSVAHTPVKRQSIGNCWLYAASSWLESLLATSTGESQNVSESYWTYWDFYHKLLAGMRSAPDADDFSTGGTWGRATAIIDKYGWVAEDEFIPGDRSRADANMSVAQACAEAYLVKATKPGGHLYDDATRTSKTIKEELNKAFSCDGHFEVDIDKAYEKRRDPQATALKNPKTGEEKALATWLAQWQDIDNEIEEMYGSEGKKLPSLDAMTSFRELEQRIKRALNDHQPVALSFYVTFNAVDGDGLFNLDTLAASQSLGDGAGHLVVLSDYTVTNVPGVGTIGEGDVSDELKAKALEGDLNYVVAKNSWGMNRADRPWLSDGYSRISWDYLKGRYYDEKAETFLPFLRGVAFPPGY